MRETPGRGCDPQRAQRPIQHWERVRRVLEKVSVTVFGALSLSSAATRTARLAAHPSSRVAIWACSCAPTIPGGVCRSPSSSHGVCASAESPAVSAPSETALRKRRARLTTAHHIGTVLASASGRRLPARVESTRMILSLYWKVSSCVGPDWPQVHAATKGNDVTRRGPQQGVTGAGSGDGG